MARFSPSSWARGSLWQAQHLYKVVPGAAGDEVQGGEAAGQTVHDLKDGAVPAHADQLPVPGKPGGVRQRGGVAAFGSAVHPKGNPPSVQESADLPQRRGARAAPGALVCDDMQHPSDSSRGRSVSRDSVP